MGCCPSTIRSSSSASHINPHSSSTKSIAAPPPPPTHPLLEEETVKEVLSETPTVPKQPTIIPKIQHHDPNKILPKIQEAPPTTMILFNNSEKLSQVSQSVISKITSSEKNDCYSNDIDDEVGRRSPATFRTRSFSDEVRRQKMAAGKSPGRIFEPSPGRERGREMGGFVRDGWRGSSGECSGRRSKSPVRRNESGISGSGLGRTMSARRSGNVSGRTGWELDAGKIRKVEGGNRDNNKRPPTTNESLENPPVSLECFIFL